MKYILVNWLPKTKARTLTTIHTILKILSPKATIALLITFKDIFQLYYDLIYLNFTLYAHEQLLNIS